jgi:hypothetical protein
MTKLKITTAVAAAAMAFTGLAATSATAQPWRDYDRRDYDQRADYRGNLTSGYVDSLEWRINNAAEEGRIPWGQARELRRELRQVQPLAHRVETGRASQWEYRRLSNVVDRIEAATGSRRYSQNRWR